MSVTLTLAALAAIVSPAPVQATAATAIGTPAIAAGTMIHLRTLEPLTTKGKKLRVGDRVRLETTEATELNGVTVIPQGTPAIGEVTEVRNKGMWGKSGKINARVLSMKVNGRQVRMTGAFDDKGTTGTAGVVGSVVLLPVAGFFMTGTSANIPAGAPVAGFLDEDVIATAAR
ncbi:hypothetical protein BW41_00565 [Sphingomonas sp. RIT328]|uniref:DUF5666 domain-containing protein n=1 Tax=Sphingomonas kyungheensis TaxID=1069987 RepID=A0ABU8H247_9SPHN|nr:hypothetical protein BW41_00565 [Sphingomonas sp. RIT328]